MLDRPSWRALTHDQKVAVLREKWVEGGMTAGQIAALYSDATRNSIIGKVRRAKMHRGRVMTVKSAGPDKKQQPRNHRIKIVKMPDTSDDLPDTDIPKAKLWDMINGNRPPLPGIVPISIMEMPARGRCRFPVQGGYCGDTCHDPRTYCDAHYAISYVPVPPRKAKAEDKMILGQHSRSVRRA